VTSDGRTMLGAPTGIRRLNRSAPFPATLLAKESSCVLAAVASKEHRVRFPDHPRSVLGRIVHGIIEDHLRSHEWDLDDRGSLRDAIRTWEVANSDDQQTKHLIPLARAIGDDGLREAIQTLVRARTHTVDWHERVVSTHRRDGAPRHSAPSSLSRTAWYEVPMADPSGEVSGRPDLVTSDGKGSLRVTDWKTGSVARGTDAFREASRQVQVYISILKSREPAAHVSGCIVSTTGTEEVPSAAADLDWIEEKRRAIRATVAETVDDRVQDLARPGRQCSSCRLRPACPSYRDWLPAQRRRFKDMVSHPEADWYPTWHGDTWGIVERIADGDGTQSAVLVDRDGTRSLLRGIDYRHGLNSQLIGRSVAAYGLLVDTGSTGDRLLMSEIRFDRRAWSSLLHQE
jgi:hypothetical protein